MKKSKVGKPLSLPGMHLDDATGAAQGSATQLQLNLANHFLIAMPSMSDPIFGGTVVYVCEHNEKGVLGVVINKPTDMTMDVLFDRIDLKVNDSLRPSVVYRRKGWEYGVIGLDDQATDADGTVAAAAAAGASSR